MRRDFLKWCAAAGLGLAAPLRSPWVARAEESQQPELPPYDGPYFIVFNAAGGW
ncbi:MAG: twin-arginine translocation signal domain-containing protein, partial [Planctomycetales bacterium]|nr:twin-arginine translocation signal domain-containing protein [Planctomycetales bacterium]